MFNENFWLITTIDVSCGGSHSINGSDSGGAWTGAVTSVTEEGTRISGTWHYNDYSYSGTYQFNNTLTSDTRAVTGTYWITGGGSGSWNLTTKLDGESRPASTVLKEVQDRFHNSFGNSSTWSGSSIRFRGRVKNSGYIYMADGYDSGSTWTAIPKILQDNGEKVVLGWFYPSEKYSGFSEARFEYNNSDPVWDWEAYIKVYFVGSWSSENFYYNVAE